MDDRPDFTFDVQPTRASSRTPALLTSGSFLGTLAAVRDLGRHGIPVTLADASERTVSARSRYVLRRLRSPSTHKPAAWIEWLMAFGAREPGQALFATSDDICWLLDMHARELEGRFQTYLPPAGSLWQLLDKRRLYRHCVALGIDQPEQWTPEQALEAGAALRYPVVVKPRTQCGLKASPKAIIIANEGELRARLAEVHRTYAYLPEVVQHEPDVATPLVQAFHPEAAHGIYSIAGFYAPDRNVMLARASQKVLQHPWNAGVGLCFEGRIVHPHLTAQLRQLFDRVGYRGPFEVEYVHLAGGTDRYLLIDVNPRFYGQMGFEISRGLPVARLTHAAAIRDWAGFDALAQVSCLPSLDAPCRYRNAWMLKLYVTTHLAGGNLDVSQWRSWLQWSHTPQAADSIFAEDDPAPSSQLRRDLAFSLVRSPRSTVRKFFVR